MSQYTTATLKKPLKVQRKIESLQNSINKLISTLSRLLGGGDGSGVSAPFKPKKRKGKGKMSTAGRARIAAAARLR